MNNHILIRNALLGSWNVGSEYIRLCGNEKFETPDELSSRFNINVLLQTLFREPSEFSAELLMESYLNAQNGDEGNQLFLRAFKIDDEYAVSIDEHIYLRKLVKKTDEPYAHIIPWYYQYAQLYIGDAWWSSQEEILQDIQEMSFIGFLKKYKGF